MTLIRVKNILGFMIRVFIVAMCFIIDIKVKADIIVESVKGEADLEFNHDMVTPTQLLKLPLRLVDSHEFDAQTFNNTILRFSYGEKKIAVGPDALLMVEK